MTAAYYMISLFYTLTIVFKGPGKVKSSSDEHLCKTPAGRTRSAPSKGKKKERVVVLSLVLALFGGKKNKQQRSIGKHWALHCINLVAVFKAFLHFFSSAEYWGKERRHSWSKRRVLLETAVTERRYSWCDGGAVCCHVRTLSEDCSYQAWSTEPVLGRGTITGII